MVALTECSYGNTHPAPSCKLQDHRGKMKNSLIRGDEISSAIEVIKSELPGLTFKTDELMKNHTTFKIGGPVRVMYFPECMSCLTRLCDILDECNITPLTIGNGSDLLVSDCALDLVVISMMKLNGISLIDTCESLEYQDIIVEAGALLSSTAVFAYENGLTGFEFAHGIPGSLGGAVLMNAGAYGGEMKDVVLSTTVYNPKTGLQTLSGAENEFSYRHSRFSETDDTILSAVVRLQKGDKESILKSMEDLSVRRRTSQPLEFPSGGSTFKRPKEGYAAALIEQAGLKGYTVGGAQVSQKHSGFIINTGSAGFSDTMAVIEHVRQTVLDKFGVELELEVKVIDKNFGNVK